MPTVNQDSLAAEPRQATQCLFAATTSAAVHATTQTGLRLACAGGHTRYSSAGRVVYSGLHNVYIVVHSKCT